MDIEAKSPTAGESVDYSKAVGQNRKRYERNALRLFWSNCFSIATDGLKTVYAASYTPPQYFRWKDQDMEKDLGGALEMTLASLLGKERILDIIANFIVFEKEKDGKIKKRWHAISNYEPE